MVEVNNEIYEKQKFSSYNNSSPTVEIMSLKIPEGSYSKKIGWKLKSEINQLKL